MAEPLLGNERDAVLELVFNRTEKCNGLSDAMLDGMRGAIQTFGRRRDLRVMLIRAEGQYLSCGADLSPDTLPDFAGSTLDGRAR